MKGKLTKTKKLIKEKRCQNCGKKLISITDKTGKKSKYEFWCPCMPNQVICIG
jgi:hypothetical protein